MGVIVKVKVKGARSFYSGIKRKIALPVLGCHFFADTGYIFQDTKSSFAFLEFAEIY